MARSRYREERTMVRGVRRLPGEDRAAFRKNVKILRNHVEKFNVNVSEICQWLIGLRPSDENQDAESGPFWEYILDPGQDAAEESEEETDRIRLKVFEVAAGLKDESELSPLSLPGTILESIRNVASEQRTKTAEKLFERMEKISSSHRRLLIRSAAEWIRDKYYRKIEIRKWQHEEWNKEKQKWEGDHPELTEKIREKYNGIFRELGIRRKNPRVCSWEQLKKGTDNCRYAGKRIPCGNSWVNHSDLCAKYKDFIKEYSQGQKKRYKKHFPENVEIYLKTRQSRPDLNQGQAMEKLFQEIRGAREWFEEAWKQYLQYMNLNEATLLERGDLPHCLKFEENKECEFNRHTELCMQYKEHLENLSQEYHELEGLYREWRRDYLSGPAKPVFCYPSSRTLTVPKIFGAGFFKVDFDNSILNLRLDDMPEGQFLSYGFKPWPDDYDKQPADIEITSANIHFIGTRARAGFRFKVKHKQSRLGISQDDIDMLRSRVYPRQAQDNDFLREARKLILENFNGEPEREMRIMTVDLGTGSCSASIFAGRELEGSVNFKVLKGDKLYNADDKPNHIKKSKGLSGNHVGVHLSSFAEGARKIAEKRNVNDVSTLSIHDMRRLSSHIRFMLRDWARLNASRITKHAEKNNVDLIVFESLRGFKAPGYDENDMAKKRRLSFFAYGIIRRKVVEKAVERGMRVVTVPYFYSSQVCSKCGKRQENHNLWWKNKAKHKFKCEHCDNEINSDENAARVLGKVFWGEIELPSVKKT